MNKNNIHQKKRKEKAKTHRHDPYYEKIIPTAWMVAYRRNLCDIPFAKEIFEKLDALRKTRDYSNISDKILQQQGLTPQIEARYKLLNRLIIENNSSQILEIAAGFSPRGLELTTNDRVVCVESDLGKIITEKRDMVRDILQESKLDRKNLFFAKGNALRLQSLKNACDHFAQGKPITVVNEGLLRYLDFQEKEKVAKNIHHILSEFGGVWITCDITLQHALKNEGKVFKGLTRVTKEITGIRIDHNSFPNVHEAKKFFENQGFSVEQHSFLEELDRLVSPQKIGMSEAAVHNLIGESVVFVMKPRIA
jgi:O-methyltransferase involved in polyketide biosynthesis